MSTIPIKIRQDVSSVAKGFDKDSKTYTTAGYTEGYIAGEDGMSITYSAATNKEFLFSGVADGEEVLRGKDSGIREKPLIPALCLKATNVRRVIFSGGSGSVQREAVLIVDNDGGDKVNINGTTHTISRSSLR